MYFRRGCGTATKQARIVLACNNNLELCAASSVGLVYCGDFRRLLGHVFRLLLVFELVSFSFFFVAAWWACICTALPRICVSFLLPWSICLIPSLLVVGRWLGSADGAQRSAADAEALQPLHRDANQQATAGQRGAGQVPRQGQQDERAKRFVHITYNQ